MNFVEACNQLAEDLAIDDFQQRWDPARLVAWDIPIGFTVGVTNRPARARCRNIAAAFYPAHLRGEFSRDAPNSSENRVLARLGFLLVGQAGARALTTVEPDVEATIEAYGERLAAQPHLRLADRAREIEQWLQPFLAPGQNLDVNLTHDSWRGWPYLHAALAALNDQVPAPPPPSSHATPVPSEHDSDASDAGDHAEPEPAAPVAPINQMADAEINPDNLGRVQLASYTRNAVPARSDVVDTMRELLADARHQHPDISTQQFLRAYKTYMIKVSDEGPSENTDHALDAITIDDLEIDITEWPAIIRRYCLTLLAWQRYHCEDLARHWAGQDRQTHFGRKNGIRLAFKRVSFAGADCLSHLTDSELEAVAQLKIVALSNAGRASGVNVHPMLAAAQASGAQAPNIEMFQTPPRTD